MAASVQIPLEVKPEVAKALRALSKRTRVTQQAYLREGLAWVLAKYRKPTPRAQVKGGDRG